MVIDSLSEGLPMQKIIDDILYEGKLLPDVWDISIFEVNGHKEISARNAVEWHEVGVVASDLSRHGDGYLGAPTPEQMAKWAKQDADEAEERRLSSLKKSAARATTMCRRVIKAEGFNELLTLTYRLNQTDRELCKQHFSAWMRRMKKALGGFRFCASFEEQKRGAMHVHVACHKLPATATHKGVKVKAWELGTRIWRDVVGDVEIPGPLLPGQKRPTLSGGLCFVGGKPKKPGDKRRRNMSIGKMASYVSKYIMKDYENSPEEKNRYSRSNGTVMSKPVKARYYQQTLLEIIDRVFECAEGDVVISHRVGRWKDSYWLVTEPSGEKNPPIGGDFC